MTTSCSAWMVATISRIAPGAGRADLGEYGVGDAAGNVGGVGVVEVFVEVGDHLAVGQREPPAEPQARTGRRPSPGRTGRRSGRASRQSPGHGCRSRCAAVRRTNCGRRGRLVDPPEEVARARHAEVCKRVADGHLDVFLGDLVGRAVRVDGARTARSSRHGRPGRSASCERSISSSGKGARHGICSGNSTGVYRPASVATAASTYASAIEQDTIVAMRRARHRRSTPTIALVEDELLVEEISIDGMCGVY